VKKFSLVLANFPFSDEFWWLKPEQQTDDKKKDKLKKEVFGKEGFKDPFGRFGRGTAFKAPPASYGDYAFILHIVVSLTDNGRAGIVCPQGVLFRGQPEVEEERGEFDDDGNPKMRRRKADDEHLIREALLDARLIDAVISYGAGLRRLPRRGAGMGTMAPAHRGGKPAPAPNHVWAVGLRALGTDFLDRISIPWSRPAAASAPGREYDMIVE
jgi:N-6 DNA Methylase